MKRFLLMMMACSGLVACGEGDDGDGAEFVEPESFVPADVREQMQDLEPLAQACVMQRFLLEARLEECAVRNFGGAGSERALLRCPDVESFPERYVTSIETCLDEWANRSCAELASGDPDTDDICAMVVEW